MSKTARVEQAAANKPPFLTPGDVSPEVLRAWEMGCRQFFMHKSIDPTEQVAKVAWGMQDPRIQDWYLNDQDRIDDLSFAEYLAEVRSYWLASDWADVVRQKMLSSTQGNKPFNEWAVDVQSQNTLLRGSTSHLDDTHLRYHLESHMHADLAADYRELKVTETDLRKWIEIVRLLDERRLREATRQKEAVEAALRVERNRSNTKVPTPRYNAKSGSSATTSSTHRAFTRLPALTEDERRLLRENDGCFKCRQPFAGHTSNICTTGFPDGASYKTLTSAIIAAKKTKQGNRMVASVGASEETTAIAVVMPSAVLGDGTDSGEECVAPIQTSHLRWDCLVDGPAVPSPVPVSALIDHGSSLVLIDESLVNTLGLRRRKLQKPLSIAVALSQNHKQPFVLSHYVKLSCSSLDYAYTSRTVRAVVAPNLCTPLLLGGPFLEHNRIVVDHELRTCIVKDRDYDLLHPPPTVPLARQQVTPTPPQVLGLRHEVVKELKTVLPELKDIVDDECEPVNGINLAAAVQSCIDKLALQDGLSARDSALKTEFADRFPTDIPHNETLPTDVLFRIHLKDANKIIQQRSYACPKKYRDAWKTLIDSHIASGRLRPSESEFSSPAFIIPKADPNVLPRWVNDFRLLNLNTVADNHPLPRIDEILKDCAKGKFFGKIDMTNAFFQTRVHPDDMKYLAVHTPFGKYEWTVMPMGVRNAPAVHQRRMTTALRHLIGRICHVYLDDIIIWSQTLTEHEQNVRQVLLALRAAHLYCSPKKTSLFNTEIDFLGHHISARGIEADTAKVAKILDWPQPRSATDVRAFLGIVRYLSEHLPDVAKHTRILNALTVKAADLKFPVWTDAHTCAFQAIKELVVSPQCLTTIDHDNPGDNKIFLTCDASDYATGAVLSWGPTWKTARPVAFDSAQLRGAELNYPVHEKELLAIIRGLKKWRLDLLGAHVHVFTDHCTLQNFATQRDLSRRQARWAEYMSQYDLSITYVKGEHNGAADALSRRADFPLPVDELCSAILSIQADPTLHDSILAGYAVDPWCKKLTVLVGSLPGLSKDDRGLFYIAGRLVIPRVKNLREQLFHAAHDAAGHFGADKSYALLRASYYWPNMRRDLVEAYIPSCAGCMRNKSTTSAPAGPLHPLPVPDARGDSVAIDFIGPLPEDAGYNMLVTMTDRLNSDVRLVPCRDNISAEHFATLFFDHWYCENGLPSEIVSDRDKLFLSKFWRALHKLTGIKLKMSSSYHPETDGASERTNKTVNQCMRYYVDRNHKGWVRALPRVHFHIMNTVNASTGMSPFQLHIGRSPRTLPPLVPRTGVVEEHEATRARALISQLEHDVMEAQDNLLAAKTAQASSTNAHRAAPIVFKAGDRVMLATKNRRRDYMQKGDKRVAKFMPRYDGPYVVLEAHPQFSTYTLDLPNSPNIFPTFHISQLRPYHANDPSLFPSREQPRPGPVVTEDGQLENFIDRIIDERRVGRGKKYLVRWVGYGEEDDEWLSRRELEDCEALDVWEGRSQG
jgi:hypothetical protein